MTDNYVCNCNCGTRIDLDQQLLQERQVWKQKYYCLKKQFNSDLGQLKQNIYAECANLMQKEFLSRQSAHNQLINQKNGLIRELNAKIINLQADFKVMQKEQQIMNARCAELESDFNNQQQEIKFHKNQCKKIEKTWEDRLNQQTNSIRSKSIASNKEDITKLEAQCEHYKHKLKEFDKKYQLIVPEVEKLKNLLQNKNQQCINLESQHEKLLRENKRELQLIIEQKAELDRNHMNCKPTIIKLNDKLDSLTQQVQRVRKVKKQIKVQPIYIERPVEVERVVEKIVQVEKVVKQYIEPMNMNEPQLDEENKKLKQEINSLLRQVNQFEEKYQNTVKEYENYIQNHENNIHKYKQQRQKLVSTIQNLNRQIDSLQDYIQRGRGNYQQQQHCKPQKIIVHVNKDGSHQTTVINEDDNKINNRNNVNQVVNRNQYRSNNVGSPSRTNYKTTVNNVRNPKKK